MHVNCFNINYVVAWDFDDDDDYKLTCALFVCLITYYFNILNKTNIRVITISIIIISFYR